MSINYNRIKIETESTSTIIWSSDKVRIVAIETYDGEETESNKSITVAELIKLLANQDKWVLEETNKDFKKLEEKYNKIYQENYRLQEKIKEYERILKTIKELK